MRVIRRAEGGLLPAEVGLALCRPGLRGGLFPGVTGDNMPGEKPPHGELVSEPITPRAGTFDTASMTRGEPGLPGGFCWRGVWLDVVETMATWKESSREGGRAGGELYLRRHYYRLRMSDNAIWTIYFIRQSARSGNAKQRWFLFTVATS